MSATQFIDESAQTYKAERSLGGFFRNQIEATLPDGSMATLIGGVFTNQGTISVGEKAYQIGRSSMSDGSGKVAEFAIKERLMRWTIATIHDLEQQKQYTLRQQRCWSSSLVLLDNEIPLGKFRSNLWQSAYEVLVQQQVPTKIVLLAIWIAMIRQAFVA